MVDDIPTPSIMPFTNNATTNNGSSSSFSSSSSPPLLLNVYTSLHATNNISYSNHATLIIGGHYRGRLSDTAIEVHREVGQRHALLEATKKRARLTSDVSSEDYHYFIRPFHKRY